MVTTMPPTTSAQGIEVESPIKSNWKAIVFMAALLLISGTTATFVGYKVKAADRDRKAQLLATYTAVGGNYEGLMTPNTTRVTPNDSSLRNVFVATYELNERARKIGLYTVLTTSPSYVIELALAGIAKTESKECLLAVQEAWKALKEDALPPGTVNFRAKRLAERYDRHHAREVEVKLFKILNENRSELGF